MHYLCRPWIFDQKTEGCANNPEKSSITKVGKHITCGYSMSTIWPFDNIKNKHALFRRNNYKLNFEKKKCCR